MDAEAAFETIHSTDSELQTEEPNAFITITVDFNHVKLDKTQPTLNQFVNSPMRDKRTIDLLYANARDVCSAITLPPLSRSDQNLHLLTTKYALLVQWQPVSTRTVRKCRTALSLITGKCSVIHMGMSRTACMTASHNTFNSALPAKTVHYFPNNKHWTTSYLKALLNQKKKAWKGWTRKK